MSEIKNEEREVMNLACSYNNIAMRIESGENVASVEKDFHGAERKYILFLNTSFLRRDPAMNALRANTDEKRNYAMQVFLEKGDKPLSEKERSELFDKYFYGGSHSPSEPCSIKKRRSP